MSTDNIWSSLQTQIYPALSGNEVFHISEFSGKLGLTFLASISIWDGNMCQICNALTYLAHTVSYLISPYEHAMKDRREGSSSTALFGSLSRQPTSPDLDSAVHRFLCGLP